MSKAIETNEAVTSNSEIIDAVECDGYCRRKVYSEATVDVVAGKIIPERSEKHRYVVSGVEKSVSPEHEEWCVDCAEEEFGIGTAAGERSLEHTNTILTPSNALSFLIGGAVTFILLAITIL